MATLNLSKYAYTGFIALSLLSCRNDDDNNKAKEPNINELQTVEFKEEAPTVLSSKRTGETKFNPTKNKTEYEYLSVEQRTHTLPSLSFVDARNNDVIFPGSILRGESFMKGAYDPLVLKAEPNDVMVSVSLRGKNYPVKESSKPVLSEIRNTTNGLVAKYKSEIDYSFVPAYVNYQSDEVTTESSFNKSFNIHANVNVLKELVSTKFNYTDAYTSSKSQKYVMVKLDQIFYNASIDPKHYSDWFKGEVNTKDYGTYEPVYVSSVDYGRVAYLLIETDKSAEEIKKIVSGGVNVAFGTVSGGVETSYNRELKNMFSQSKIRVLIVGGPARLGGQVDSYDKFLQFIKTPSIDDLISSAAPVAYKVRRLKDNTEVEVRTLITEKVLSYKEN